MFKTVLFPIDQSRNSQDALNKVAELVKFCGAQLYLLTVSAEESDAAESPKMTSEAAEALLSAASAKFAELEIPAETVHRSGRPAFSICDVADELDVDLIMMSCRGIGLSEDHTEESVSNRVINLSPCPVMVIP